MLIDSLSTIQHLKRRCSVEWFGTFWGKLSQIENRSEIKPPLFWGYSGFGIYFETKGQQCDWCFSNVLHKFCSETRLSNTRAWHGLSSSLLYSTGCLNMLCQTSNHLLGIKNTLLSHKNGICTFMRCGNLTYDTWIWLKVTSMASTASNRKSAKNP